MIAISLLYFCCKFYAATIKHKESIILLIFQICILEIQECVYMDGFPKSGHICTIHLHIAAVIYILHYNI